MSKQKVRRGCDRRAVGEMSGNFFGARGKAPPCGRQRRLAGPRFGDRGDRRRPLEPRWFELDVLASDVSELGAGFGEPIESGLVDDVGVRCRGFVASEEGLNFAKLLKDFVV